MWPTHSVCVPFPCGLKAMLRKFTEPPNDTSPTQSPARTGSIFTGEAFHAFTFFSPARNGIEMSMGRDRSALYIFPL